MSITIHIDDREAVGLLEQLASGRQVESARRRATRKAADWVKGRLASLMAQQADIPRRAFANFRIKRRQLPDGNMVWFGTLPVAAGYVGRLKQGDLGAFAREYYFEHGFIATMKSGHTSIFARQGRLRLPVLQQTVDLVTADQAARQVADQAGPELRKKLQQELAFELRRGS